MTAEPSEPVSASSAGARNGLVARAARWAFRDGWRLAVFVLGLAAFGLGATVTICYRYIHHNDFGSLSLQTLSGGLLTGVTSSAGWEQYDLSACLFWMLPGTVLATLGFFLWRRRFSLRTLLVTVLLIAFILSVPFVFPPSSRGPFVGFRLDIMDESLTPAMRVELGEWLRAYLAPQALNDALPEEVRRAAGLEMDQPFCSTQAVEASKEPDAFWLNTEVNAHLTREQLATLGEFHATYLHAILADFYAAKKIPFTDTSVAPALGGKWAGSRAGWLKAHAAAPFAAPPP